MGVQPPELGSDHKQVLLTPGASGGARQVLGPSHVIWGTGGHSSKELHLASDCRKKIMMIEEVLILLKSSDEQILFSFIS